MSDDEDRPAAAPDAVERRLKKLGIPVDRDSYIQAAWMGDAMPEEWTAEYEAELPKHLQNWDLFEKQGGQVVYKGP